MAAGLGEAASILDILGVTGQAIESASTLYTFCKTYKQVHSKLECTTQEVQGLKNILIQVQGLLPMLSAAASHFETMNALERQVKACKEDLGGWTQKINSLNLRAAKGTTFENVKIAADKNFFGVIRGLLSSHREQIMLKITLLGSYQFSGPSQFKNDDYQSFVENGPRNLSQPIL